MSVEIKLLPDEEIRDWMDAETKRLGDRLKGFEITWSYDDKTRWLTISSVTPTTICPESKYGISLNVGEIKDPYGEHLPLIQSEGRKLYYRLRKDYPSVYRDLGTHRGVYYLP